MATPEDEARCSTCAKTKSEPGTSLRRCAGCKIPYYCSRQCQKADWKEHRKVCSSKNPSSPAAETSNAGNAGNAGQQPQQPSKGLSVTVEKPFHKLDSKTWLHDRPEKDVYKLLVDTYRMKVEDDYNLEGDASVDSIYGGAQDHGRRDFQRFLKRVESKPGLLPSWWSPEKSAACIRAGLDQNSGSYLGAAMEKSDVIEHYGERTMPMQLRMFGEEVYGRGPGGQSGTQMRKMMMQSENGEGSMAFLGM